MGRGVSWPKSLARKRTRVEKRKQEFFEISIYYVKRSSLIESRSYSLLCCSGAIKRTSSSTLLSHFQHRVDKLTHAWSNVAQLPTCSLIHELPPIILINHFQGDWMMMWMKSNIVFDNGKIEDNSRPRLLMLGNPLRFLHQYSNRPVTWCRPHLIW